MNGDEIKIHHEKKKKKKKKIDQKWNFIKKKSSQIDSTIQNNKIPQSINQ